MAVILSDTDESLDPFNWRLVNQIVSLSFDTSRPDNYSHMLLVNL